MNTKMIATPFKGISVTHKIKNTEVLNHIMYLRDDIRKVLGNDHWYYRRATIHITLIDHISNWTKFIPYRNVREAYDLTLIASENQRAFHICFNEFKLTNSGIIVVSHDSGEFNNMRNCIIDKGKYWNIYKSEMPLYPNIVHSTIIRFNTLLSDNEKDMVQIILDKYNGQYIGSEYVKGFDIREFSREFDYSSGHNVKYVYLGNEE